MQADKEEARVGVAGIVATAMIAKEVAIVLLVSA